MFGLSGYRIRWGKRLRGIFFDGFVLVLLDLMIPKKSGMEVMARIRESNTVPIIILPAKEFEILIGKLNCK
jgi:DNA-binding response OmpR family regulator